MKFVFFFIIDLMLLVSANAQVNIQQLGSFEDDKLISVQNNHSNFRNIATIGQLGADNNISLEQGSSSEIEGEANKSFLFQDGYSNRIVADQLGSENTFLSFQIGYLSTVFSDLNSSILGQFDSPHLSLLGAFLGGVLDGENNVVESTQQGNSNNLLTLQVGKDNYIGVTQKGNNNTLVVSQVGRSNEVKDFHQDNNDGGLNEAITQLGIGNKLEVENTPGDRSLGNSYFQAGNNLGLKVDLNLLSSDGGVGIQQVGHDMNITVSQSYFSFPMK